MKILMINKFLHPVGGAETYIFKLGKALKQCGHEVEYFGMKHCDRCVGNSVNAYTSNMNFRNGLTLKKITYPFKTIYSIEARRQIRKVLNDFKPDVCHLNNFNYQLTPSIILEIKKWNKDCKIVYTAHDYQLICPNHMCHNPNTDKNCENCLSGKFVNCIKGRCIHGSFVKSVIGTLEAMFWRWKGVYRHIDSIICCSHFIKTKMDTNPLFAEKTVTLHNFIDFPEEKTVQKKDYILYFGRYSQEKGLKTLIEAAKELPQYQFVFAGSGPLKNSIELTPNIKDVGFQSGENLKTLIKEARFSIYPSEWYENCPLSVIESQVYGTAVLGADIGGISELIEVGKTGELFQSANKTQLKEKIQNMYSNADKYMSNRHVLNYDDSKTYVKRIEKIYKGEKNYDQ